MLPRLLRLSHCMSARRPHFIHCTLAVSHFSNRRDMYDAMRDAYNSIRPPGCRRAPPYEEWRTITQICSNMFCRSECLHTCDTCMQLLSTHHASSALRRDQFCVTTCVGRSEITIPCPCSLPLIPCDSVGKLVCSYAWCPYPLRDVHFDLLLPSSTHGFTCSPIKFMPYPQSYLFYAPLSRASILLARIISQPWTEGPSRRRFTAHTTARDLCKRTPVGMNMSRLDLRSARRRLAAAEQNVRVVSRRQWGWQAGSSGRQRR